MGKVHGSLARAGKVKSQTPKVRYHYGGKRWEKMECSTWLQELQVLDRWLQVNFGIGFARA